MNAVNPPLGRSRLLDIAAHILATEGAGALTVRRLASELGSSTMSLYSHFAGKDELIEAIADEFVIRFGEALKSVPVTDDPLYDFVCMSHRYRSISLENRDLYRVALVSGRLSIERDAPRGMKGMFDYCVGAVARCIAAGALTIDDPRAGLLVVWTGVHGQVALEMEQVFPDAAAAMGAWLNCLRAMLLGLGAVPARADRVFRSARPYLDAGSGPAAPAVDSARAPQLARKRQRGG